MDFTLILGPMKSGKTLDLISRVSPLKYTPIKFELIQPKRNVRDEEIKSRAGAVLSGRKVASLAELLNDDIEIICIDELHMFQASDAAVLNNLLKRGVKIIASGLDMDYKGKLFEIIARVLELGPQEIIYKRAVCENCFNFNAIFTQICRGDKPVVDGLPPVVPDDGTYTYKAVCRSCFIR